MNFPTIDRSFFAGECFDAYRVLGAHPCRDNFGQEGWRFAVWAPGAVAVEICGGFDGWGPGVPMQKADTGVWSGFVPGLAEGELYKYRIHGKDGSTVMRADPYAFSTELRPGTASRLARMDFAFDDSSWMERRDKCRNLPLNIYELHAGSWKHKPNATREDGSDGWYNYRELARELIPWLLDHRFTHVELLPLAEHPFDGSWGYQGCGYFAPTQRIGGFAGFAALVDALHAAGIAVLMDFVPVHFAPDADRLACFDGAPLFESGPSDWGSLNFDLASPPVRSFLLSSAAFWLQVCRCDGLRVDAIGNALYHCPNGWQAAEFFKTLTAGLHARFPGCMLVAEDSAGSMNATSDTASGGLGFDYVWEIGWTQDTLAYFAAPFGGRSALFRQLCGSFGPFGAVQGINALSHDENHPASIFTRLYGNAEEKLAQMRLLLLLQAARPGKSLLFAGVEFGQPDAFTDGREPNWAMLADAGHRALADYSKALNAFCLAHPALYAPQSFAWAAQDASTGVLGFTLQAGCETLLCALNTGTQAVQGFGLKPGWGSCALPLFAAGWVDNAPRPIANGWLALDLAPLSGGIWQIE